MTVTIDGQLGITTPSLTATVVTTDVLNLNGPFNLTGTFNIAGTLDIDGSIVLRNTINTNTVTILSGVNTADWTFTLPIDGGGAGQVLSTDGAGNTYWQTGLGTGTVNPGVLNQVAYYAATGDTVSGAPYVTLTGGDLTLGDPGVVAGNLTLAGSASQITVLSAAANAGNWTFTLPSSPGAFGQLLSTDGAGNTSWFTLPTTGTVNAGNISELTYYAATGDAVSGNSNAKITNGSLSLGSIGAVAGELSLYGATSGTITLNTPAVAGTWTMTLPDNNGTNGQALVTDGNGVTSWAAVGGSGTVSNGNTNELAYYSATGIVVSGNGNVRAAAGALTLGVAGADAGSLTLSGGTSGTVTLQTAAVAGNWTMTLPASDGANGQALVTDGSGITSWAAVGGSGTVNTGNADELAYYSATGTAVVGNSNVRASSGTLTLGDTGSVAGSLALSGSTSGLVTVNVAAAAGTWTLTLPSDDGSANQVLTTDGSGVTSWVSFGSVNSGTANQLAYYSGTGTAVSGNANATVNSGALTLGVAGSAAGSVSLSGATSGTVTVNTAAVAGTWSLTLPASAGTNGYVLTTNGSGTTTWGAASLVVGTSAITSGTSGRILYDNAGSVGEKTVTGTGDVVLATTPLITGLNEKKTAPSISGGTLTLDCSAGNVFSVSLNANITTLTFTNVPTSGTSYALTLSFTADGTGRTITWGASVLWPGGVAPTLTSTNGKVDTFVLYTFDAGTTWYAFTAGQNS